MFHKVKHKPADKNSENKNDDLYQSITRPLLPLTLTILICFSVDVKYKIFYVKVLLRRKYSDIKVYCGTICYDSQHLGLTRLFAPARNSFEYAKTSRVTFFSYL